MDRDFLVRNTRGNLKLIPYIGCKSGFSHIFDALIPDNYGRKIYDVFGGGGGFTLYACSRFGSRNVVYNDHNPVITNLFNTLKSDPDGLWHEYQRHYEKSSPDRYLRLRRSDLEDGTHGAGRFFYLAKNAFSGKIRFNSNNEFNSPMRKNSKCPRVDLGSIRRLSDTIRHLRITTKDFAGYGGVRDGFVYLDPPYLNNTNGHYNAVVSPKKFLDFVREVHGFNKVMISEHNKPDTLMLGRDYRVYHVKLKRSLQYFTQDDSNEIIAINYRPAGKR